MLPTELLLPIFAYADVKTTSTLSRTCRTWHSIIRTHDAAIYLPKLRRVSFEAAIPPLLPGETYKGIYKIHHAWENNGRRLKREARSAERVDAIPPKAGRSYLMAPNSTVLLILNAESAGDVVAYTLEKLPRPTSVVYTFVLGATTERESGAIPQLLYRARGDGTSVEVLPSIRSDLLVTVTNTGIALFWDAASKRKRHQIIIGQSIVSGKLCGDVFVAIQRDGRAKGWKMNKGQYQITEPAWEVVCGRARKAICDGRLAVSESVVAWIEDAGVIVRRAADGALVGKPFLVAVKNFPSHRRSFCQRVIPDEVALTRTHLIAHSHVDRRFHVYALSNLKLVYRFQLPVLPNPGSFAGGLHLDYPFRISDSGSAMWATAEPQLLPMFPSPHHFVLLDMPNGRVVDWVQKVPKTPRWEGPAFWVWYRANHGDGEGGDVEDEECVWMRVYG
ncbi:hypothetical protein HK104_000808 [Borealophlyctis nickersoniae]|nr:hypothetical protein HK104_000808 [Borealophlyctis nickersoniae]